jgi:hypothetical protein
VDAFRQVITEYDGASRPVDLAWFAAGAYAQLGRLAGHSGDWEAMVNECSQAIAELERLPNESVRGWTARYWAWIALAETRCLENDLARRAYEQAIELGTGYVSESELADWQSKLEDLQEGKNGGTL